MGEPVSRWGWFAIGTHQRESNHTLLGGAIMPRMTRSILDDAIARFKHDFSSIVQL